MQRRVAGKEVDMLPNNQNKLVEAARSGYAKKVKYCLSQKGCDALAKGLDGRTALMWAARSGHEDCVTLLVPVSDPLAQDDNGRSALMLAALHEQEECVRMLIPCSDPMVLTCMDDQP